MLTLAPQIGINYVGQKGELKGCINDARNIQRFLCGESFGDRFWFSIKELHPQRTTVTSKTTSSCLQTTRTTLDKCLRNKTSFVN